jgi:hypothetical protein
MTQRDCAVENVQTIQFNVIRILCDGLIYAVFRDPPWLEHQPANTGTIL